MVLAAPRADLLGRSIEQLCHRGVAHDTLELRACVVVIKEARGADGEREAGSKGKADVGGCVSATRHGRWTVVAIGSVKVPALVACQLRRHAEHSNASLQDCSA